MLWRTRANVRGNAIVGSVPSRHVHQPVCFQEAPTAPNQHKMEINASRFKRLIGFLQQTGRVLLSQLGG